MSDLPKLNNLSRAIPDRLSVNDLPTKRVLDALAESQANLYKYLESIQPFLVEPKESGPSVDRAAGTGQREADEDEQQQPRYEGKFSIELVEGNKFQFVNDENPAAKSVYVTNGAGIRGWVTSTTFVNDIIGDALTEFLDVWITNYIAQTARRQFVSTGVQYDEPTRTFSQVFVELIVLGVTQGSTLVGNVFIAQECP